MIEQGDVTVDGVQWWWMHHRLSHPTAPLYEFRSIIFATLESDETKIILSAMSCFSGLCSDLGSGWAGRIDFTRSDCRKKIHIIFTGQCKYCLLMSVEVLGHCFKGVERGLKAFLAWSVTFWCFLLEWIGSLLQVGKRGLAEDWSSVGCE